MEIPATSGGGSSARRAGVWLVGAAGNLGATVVVGGAALRRGLVASTGLVTETPPFSEVALPALGELVFGGHELRPRTLLESALDLAGPSGFLPAPLVEAVRSEVAAASAEVRPGTLAGASAPVRGLLDTDAPPLPFDATGAAAVERLAADIASFSDRHRLDRVVVVNLASTEPPPTVWPVTSDELERLLAAPDGGGLPSSSLYALAACEAGCSYVNFTPSAGASPPAVAARFEAAGLPHAGSDGKTGETLVKSALAPLFAIRNLLVHSWTGQNLLGNRDGEVLADPASCESKLRSKSDLLSGILGYGPDHRVGIDFVRSLGDWKVAWDFIHFEGFLGTPMRMHFTWEGCDSALAAPLVIDLVRLTALAHRRRESGPLGHLALFFKAPLGCEEHALGRQFDLLLDYAQRVAEESAAAALRSA